MMLNDVRGYLAVYSSPKRVLVLVRLEMHAKQAALNPKDTSTEFCKSLAHLIEI